MRYYSVAVIGAGAPFNVRYDEDGIWGSHVNGIADPGAQQVEFHIEEFRPNQPTPDSTLTVHGVSWEQIRHTDQLMGKPIVIHGGMAPGLPLATLQSRRKGLLVMARIFRAWGNWIGTDMSIGMQFQAAGTSEAKDSGGGGAPQGSGGGESDATGGGAQESPAMARRRLVSRGVGYRSIDHRPFPRGASAPFWRDVPVATPADVGDIGQFSGGDIFGAATNIFGDTASSLFGGGTQGLRAPLNLIHNMMPNMSLSSAISETLGKAFPQGGSNVKIADGLKLGYQDAGMYQNMEQYAGYIQKLSQSIKGIKNYPGVQMSAKDNTINVWDTTGPIGNSDVQFWELIGQPTWIAPNTIQVKTVLRGDLTCGMFITLPAKILTNLEADAIVGGLAGSNQRTNITLDGGGYIMNILHVGDFRNPDGVGWSTTIDVYVSGMSGTGSSLDTSGAADNLSGGTPGIPNLPTLTMVPSRFLARGTRQY